MEPGNDAKRFEQLRSEGWSDQVVDFASALDADGYDMVLNRLDDGRIRGEVIARPDACEDCLVPKPVMASILAGACAVDTEHVELRYPGDAEDA